MGWLIYLLLVLAIGSLAGWHLTRFQDAFTDMVGMMAGMAMGMMNGFIVGYAAAAATTSLFWGNLFGMLLGLILGIYYGRGGGLIGSIDGGLGGVMGGAMGAMLAIMVQVPSDALVWTAVLITGLYALGILSLLVLIEQHTPVYAAYHRLAPLFSGNGRARDLPADDGRGAPAEAPQAANRPPAGDEARGPRRLVDYYAFLEVDPQASTEEIEDAYSVKAGDADAAIRARADRAFAALGDPDARAAYDQALADNQAALAGATGSGSSGPANARKRRG